jgi:fermentation-respiration switch protein FrsA (DUF1100 family)
MVLAAFTFGCDGTRLIFSSSKDLLSTPDDMGLNYEEVWLETRDGVQLHGWLVPGKPGMPLVFFCHGNAANISHRVDNLKYFNAIGLSTFIFDYRGFGKSRGQPIREEDLYMDARSALDYLLIRGWSPSRIIYYGRSMGAAVSLQMGLESPPAVVVLECGFTSLPDIAWHTAPVSYALIGWMAIDAKFDNLNKVDKLTTPIIIFQGDQDNIVPQEMAKRLFQRANEPKALYLIPGGGHSDLFEVGGEKYKNAWIDLIRQWVPSEIW